MYVRGVLPLCSFCKFSAVYDNLKYSITYIFVTMARDGSSTTQIYTYIMYLSRAHIDRGIGTHRCIASSPPPAVHSLYKVSKFVCWMYLSVKNGLRDIHSRDKIENPCVYGPHTVSPSSSSS